VAVGARGRRRGLSHRCRDCRRKLVVTTYAPTRRIVTIVVLVLLVAGGVYGMFEFGRTARSTTSSRW
jgi:hypothetical protein